MTIALTTLPACAPTSCSVSRRPGLRSTNSLIPRRSGREALLTRGLNYRPVAVDPALRHVTTSGAWRKHPATCSRSDAWTPLCRSGSRRSLHARRARACASCGADRSARYRRTDAAWARGLPNLYVDQAQVALATAVAECLRECGRRRRMGHRVLANLASAAAAPGQDHGRPGHAAKDNVSHCRTRYGWHAGARSHGRHQRALGLAVRRGCLGSMQAKRRCRSGRQRSGGDPVPSDGHRRVFVQARIDDVVRCEADDEHASLATAILHRLHADGRLARIATPLRDDEASVGTVWPVAHVHGVRETHRRWCSARNDMPRPIPARYHDRTLPDSMLTLYDAFLAFVEARRTRE